MQCNRSAHLAAGFWIENLTDVFIVTAFPTVNEAWGAFGIIFGTRVIENTAYLGFQTEPWFRFRIWIKGKFKPEQVRPSHATP
jgi:hypothetical protein